MAGDQGTEAVVDMDIHDEEFWYVDENMPSAKHPVQRFSEKRENMNCQSKANVEVECQHFSKYINVYGNQITCLSKYFYLGCGGWNLTAGPVSSQTSPALATLVNVSLKKSCTATIFSPLWLLTSYSCIQTGNISSLEWVVLAGISDTDPLADDKTQIRIVREVVPHPLARLGQHLTSPDLALVQLDQPLSLGDLVGAVCLASKELQEDQVCISVGWTLAETGLFHFHFHFACLILKIMLRCEFSAKNIFLARRTCSSV